MMQAEFRMAIGTWLSPWMPLPGYTGLPSMKAHRTES